MHTETQLGVWRTLTQLVGLDLLTFNAEPALHIPFRATQRVAPWQKHIAPLLWKGTLMTRKL